METSRHWSFLNGELGQIGRQEKKTEMSELPFDGFTEAKRFSVDVKVESWFSPTECFERKKHVVYVCRPRKLAAAYILVQYKNIVIRRGSKAAFGIAKVVRRSVTRLWRGSSFSHARVRADGNAIFFAPSQMLEKNTKNGRRRRWNWYWNMVWRYRYSLVQHEKLAHYASEAYDIEYNFKRWAVI